MNPRSQRDDVMRSLISTEDGRACDRSSYARHPLAQAVPQGTPSVGALAQSIRELGEMLAVADAGPDCRVRLAELERLAGRVAERVESLRRLIDGEHMDAMGVSG